LPSSSLLSREGPKPPKRASPDPDERSRIAWHVEDVGGYPPRYCVRLSGGSHGRTTRGSAQRRGGAKRRPRYKRMGVERGQCSEEVRVRNQVGKESTRTQALLYVESKLCASAIWPFSEDFAPPRLGQVLQEREAYILGYHALATVLPRNRTRSARKGVLHPPGCSILMGVPFSGDEKSRG
jgi:hypothetical protein